MMKSLEGVKSKVTAINSKANRDRIVLTDITVEVNDQNELNKILRVLRTVDSVYEVKRKKG